MTLCFLSVNTFPGQCVNGFSDIVHIDERIQARAFGAFVGDADCRHFRGDILYAADEVAFAGDTDDRGRPFLQDDLAGRAATAYGVDAYIVLLTE